MRAIGRLKAKGYCAQTDVVFHHVRSGDQCWPGFWKLGWMKGNRSCEWFAHRLGRAEFAIGLGERAYPVGHFRVSVPNEMSEGCFQ